MVNGARKKDMRVQVLAAAIAAIVVVMALVAALTSGRNGNPAVNISASQRSETGLTLLYKWHHPQRVMIFEAVAGDYRKLHWQIASPDFEITREGEFDRIARIDGKAFSRIELIAQPYETRLEKDYQPVVRYGEGGVLLYTGHFMPVTNDGARIDAVFDFTPLEDAQIVAFDAHEKALDGWRSPMAHPAFVYMGPLAPIETDNVMALIDPETPDWIVDEFNALVRPSFAKLAEQFGFTPQTKPNLFLSAPMRGDVGRLSYAGDALPAQFQITLEGGAWREPSEKAQGVFVFSTVHEAVHLWQAAARPGAIDPPEWIHEGAADAIAAETLVALGIWDGAALEQAEADARRDCAVALDQGSLNGARARGDYRALYACGHVIASALAVAERKSTADFWRAFIDEAQAADGYSEAMFYDLAATRTGDKKFAERLRSFAQTPLAAPEKEIDALMDAAARLAREAGH